MSIDAGNQPGQRVSRERYLRERMAREEAERLLEAKSRELFEANQKLEAEARRLDATVAARTMELREAVSRAEAGTRTKAQFLANMSHEIRTPLNAVLGMAQSLLDDALQEVQRDKVAIIVESGRSLTALLNDVLDLTKIEAGKLEITPIPGDLRATLRRTCQLFEAQAEEKGLALTLVFDSDLPPRLSYDPVRIGQCVTNLVSNAIKFTHTGHVTVSVSATEEVDGLHRVRIDVMDTGIGMSEDTQTRLFAIFTQADGAITRRFGGTGLGLAISRQLARLMDGDLTVRSVEGRGSTFSLSLSIWDVPEVAPAEPKPGMATAGFAQPSRALRGVRVLLTDDNAINRQVVKLFLAPLGLEVVEAENGQEALDALAARPFDIVLLDVHMPVMDGREAIGRIRLSSEAWCSVPVIALTADAMAGDRERFIALGMTDYLSKPVDQRELVSKIAKYTAECRLPVASGF